MIINVLIVEGIRIKLEVCCGLVIDGYRIIVMGYLFNFEDEYNLFL